MEQGERRSRTPARRAFEPLCLELKNPNRSFSSQAPDLAVLCQGHHCFAKWGCEACFLVEVTKSFSQWGEVASGLGVKPRDEGAL